MKFTVSILSAVTAISAVTAYPTMFERQQGSVCVINAIIPGRGFRGISIVTATDNRRKVRLSALEAPGGGLRTMVWNPDNSPDDNELFAASPLADSGSDIFKFNLLIQNNAQLGIVAENVDTPELALTTEATTYSVLCEQCRTTIESEEWIGTNCKFEQVDPDEGNASLGQCLTFTGIGGATIEAPCDGRIEQKFDIFNAEVTPAKTLADGRLSGALGHINDVKTP